MHTFNDTFIRSEDHAAEIVRRASETLWGAVQYATASVQTRIEAPPWLQGMAVLATATPTKDSARAYKITVTLVPSKVNPSFEPLTVTVRSADAAADFHAAVEPAMAAMLREADKRVPSQTFADMVWKSGVCAPTHRLYGRFRADYPLECARIGARPVYSTQSAEAARALIEWFNRWASEHALDVPSVAFIDGWGVLPASVIADPFNLSADVPVVLPEGADPFALPIEPTPIETPRKPVSPLN